MPSEFTILRNPKTMTGLPMSTTRTSLIFYHYSIPATAPIELLLTSTSFEPNRWVSRRTHRTIVSLPRKSRSGGVLDLIKRED